MRTKEAIFFNKLVHYNPKDFPNGMKNAIYKAMQEYAEEYHRAELLKLNKSDVISSVCGSCLMYLTCNNKDRDKYRCKYYDDEP